MGKAAINVANGNLIVATTDVDIHETGLDLAFTRYYNSASEHDVSADDGSEKALFGNKWTNNFDAHFVYTAATGTAPATVTIFDETGAAYVYTGSNGSWIPPAGQYATLQTIPTDSCGLDWTKPDGITYYFHDDNNGGNSCSVKTGMKGRLYEILGRNNDNTITLSTTFTSAGNSAEDIQQIVATYSNGTASQSLTMGFQLWGSYNEMTTLTLPNSQGTLRYVYDSSTGDLLEVDKPGNPSSASSVPGGHSVPSGDVPELYAYHPGSLLYWCMPPRTSISFWANGTPTEGSQLVFTYDSSSRLSTWSVYGVLDPNPDDGLGTKMQTGYNATWTSNWIVGTFTYNSGQTLFSDSSNHAMKWSYNGSGSVTARGVYNGSVYLTTDQTWDNNLNLTSSIDPNLNETDYKYDGSGDRVEVVAPSVSTYQGTFHPTQLFSYDDSHNLLAYCDPVKTNALGKNNLASPGQTPCPTGTPGNNGNGIVVYAYSTPNREPYGCLSDVYSAVGYHLSLTYGGYCGVGLPTQIQGPTITQSFSNPTYSSTRTPTLNFTYDNLGRLSTYGAGNGQWSYGYDPLNRVDSVTDPDAATSTENTSYICYNADGTIAATTSPKQYQLGGVCSSYSTKYTYDADGDIVTELHHFGGTGGTTAKYYDGLDRLIEVVTPADGNIDSGNSAYRRYIYDLTTGAQVSIGGGGAGGSANYLAYGNLYKTEECRALHCANNFTDINGNAYDALDRPTTRYQHAPTTASNVPNLPGTPPPSPTPGQNPGPLAAWKCTYDATLNGVTQFGLLSSCTDPEGVTSTFSYNALNKLTSRSYTSDPSNTPTATYTYDADGRIATAANSVAKDTYIWNPDGTLASDTEGGILTNPATISYGYYPDGKRMNLTIADPGATFNQTRQYAYRADGARTYLNVVGLANPFTWTYTNAGRLSTQSDPLTGSTGFTSNVYSGDVTIGSKVQAYDSNTGLLSTLTMPDGLKEKNFAYDAESQPNALSVDASGFGLTLPSSNSFVTGVHYDYDVLGELYRTQATSQASGGYQTLQQQTFAYGHPEGGSSTSVDTLTGAIYSLQVPVGGGNSCNEDEVVSYDADGRQGSNIANPIQTQTCVGGPAWVNQWGYDALNHTIGAQQCTPTTPPTCTTLGNYGWDALGNLRTYSNGSSNYTLHWDGSDLLFATTNNGVVEQYNVEKLAERSSDSTGNLGPLVVYDRDFSGAEVEAHTSQSDSGLNVTPDHFSLNKLGLLGIPNITGTYPSSSSGSASGSGPVIDMQRTDGYQVGSLTIQGVRAYDTNTQQWTTPDAYKGDVDDPTSQMAYEWNSNNPITMTDPSGYATIYDQPCADGSNPALQDGGCGSGFDTFSSWNFASTDYLPVVTPYALEQVKATDKWIFQPCHASALGKGAISVGIDSLGIIPGATLPKLIGRAAGLGGAAAEAYGTKTLTGATGALGAAQGAAGAVNEDQGDDKLLEAASGGAAVAGLVPFLNEGATGVSIGLDVLKTAKQIGKCP